MVNQINMTGPKVFPMEDVPNCWKTNRKIKISKVIGMTGRSGDESFNPSIDESTVMEGVITPSASNAAPPMAAGMNIHFLLLPDQGIKGKNPPFAMVVGF